MVSISTVRRFALILGLGITMTGLAACGGDDADTVSAACERFDECNVLPAGLSVDECVENLGGSVASFPPSARNDWESMMDGCLTFDTCNVFIDCVTSAGLIE